MRPLLSNRIAARTALILVLGVQLGGERLAANSLRYETLHLPTSSVTGLCGPYLGGDYQYLIIYLDITTTAKSLTFTGPSLPGDVPVIWSFPVSGDPATGLTLDFGGCQTGSVVLGTAGAFNTDGVNGQCPGLMRGDLNAFDGRPVLTQCDDSEAFVAGCAASAPILLAPADAATGVGVTPTLRWQTAPGDYCVEGIGIQSVSVFMGTSPETMEFVWWVDLGAGGTSEWTPSTPLLQNTTYYWAVHIDDYYYEYAGSYEAGSETYSFTTTDVVSVEELAWGAVKRLYRE